VRLGRFSVEKIVSILKQTAVGLPLADLMPGGNLGADVLSREKGVGWAALALILSARRQG
jgi:hypothetical protein